ncbi:MAG: ABC transporter ATP-binding protein/permease [Acidimicrobiia bacterium]|nr:ABC transporter ATP-binding protein/permease [Acidimicrobiia bacterium]
MTLTEPRPEVTEALPDPVISPYEPDESEGALSVIGRGIAASPALRRGVWLTAGMGLSVALGQLAVPVLVQRALDRGGLTGSGEVDTDIIIELVLVVMAVVLLAAVANWRTQRRLLQRAEETLYDLRTRAFAKVHQLSVADHNDTRKGILLSRVTSDVEALAQFVQWGFFIWVTSPVLILGMLTVLAVYSWPLAIVVAVAFAPALPLMRWVQKRQLAANDQHRTAVGYMLSSFSEAVTGAATIRAYGAQQRQAETLSRTINHRYHTKLRANRYMALVFVISDFFAALAFGLVLVLGIRFREQLGIEPGEFVASLFIVTLIAGPIATLTEVFDQTQSAVSAWRKVLHLIDAPVDVADPEPGREAPRGAVRVEVEGLSFRYRVGPRVLVDVTTVIEAGTNVAIVGETGSGKTTFAKLLCRLADPQDGSIRLNGVEIRELSAASRLETVRMVPQDGFLFDASIGDNIRFGRPDATDSDIAHAIDRLELRWWVDQLPDGLKTGAGERGGNLSVGERQLVALIRAALADPGLLILDEATSAVDPETDAALTGAIQRLSEGRTIVSIAHRLATAEASDLVIVFDRGQIVQTGTHTELVDQPGIYRRLHQAWIGATR